MWKISLPLPTTLTGGSDSWPGAPTLLSVWLPLTEVTTDNGCMMIVPRTLDRHFTNRWAYAHMRPALLGDDDGVLELRFDLQAPRVATVSTPAHPSSAPACTVCETAGLRDCFFLKAARALAPLARGSIVAWQHVQGLPFHDHA